MDNRKKGKIMAFAGALTVHLLVVILLILITVHVTIPEKGGGVILLAGNVQQAQGDFHRDAPQSVPTKPTTPVVPEPKVVEQPKEEIITQSTEETVALPKEVKKKKVTSKPKIKPQEKRVQPTKEEIERRKHEAEMKRQKALKEAAEKRVAGAFSKSFNSSKKNNSGTSKAGSGIEGSQKGTSNVGAKSGNPGYGTFDLAGRSIGKGGLPRPVYNVQEEGRVVVNIVVNPQGKVISTTINRRTNTVNAALRKAAENAAKLARFNSVKTVNNQIGTITYYFNLR